MTVASLYCSLIYFTCDHSFSVAMLNSCSFPLKCDFKSIKLLTNMVILLSFWDLYHSFENPTVMPQWLIINSQHITLLPLPPWHTGMNESHYNKNKPTPVWLIKLKVIANEPLKESDVILASWRRPQGLLSLPMLHYSFMLLMVAWQDRVGLIRDNIIAIKHLRPWTPLFQQNHSFIAAGSHGAINARLEISLNNSFFSIKKGAEFYEMLAEAE